MTSTATGRQAEAAAAEYLAFQGYKILARNWRTRVCEIDLIAEKAKIIYFIEVKFRMSDKQGGGLDYITPRKLEQMRFAAEIWCAENDWAGDWRLCAAAVVIDGITYKVDKVIDVSS